MLEPISRTYPSNQWSYDTRNVTLDNMVEHSKLILTMRFPTRHLHTHRNLLAWSGLVSRANIDNHDYILMKGNYVPNDDVDHLKDASAADALQGSSENQPCHALCSTT